VQQERGWYTRGWCESVCYESTQTARLRKLTSRGWYYYCGDDAPRGPFKSATAAKLAANRKRRAT
jgi:hypothetical protein